MKKLILTIACSAMLAAEVFAQSQTLALTTSGTSTTSGAFAAGMTFNLDVSITFTGYTGDGLSYWLQVPTALAPYITITSEQYFTFTDPNNAGPKTFGSSSGASAGFLTDQGVSDAGDLGATALTSAADVGAGTYQVSTLNFTLSPSAPIGTYTIRTTVLSPKISEVNDNTFSTHALPGSSYSLMVIPEPSTVAFLLGGVGVLLATNFARRRKA